MKASVVETVTSEKPMYDLINPLEGNLVETVGESRSNAGSVPIRNAIKDLAGAAFSTDVDAFLQGRDEVVRMAEELGRPDVAKLLEQMKVELWPADPAKKRHLKLQSHQPSTI